MRRFADIAGTLADWAGRAVVRAPGVAALLCAVTGVYVLAGLGWALLSAVPFLLAADRSMP